MCFLVVWCLVQSAVQAPPRDPRPAAAAGSAILRGVVVDEPTGAPVAGARVTVHQRPTPSNPPGPRLFSAEATTTDDGRFELTGVPAGEIMISADPGEYRASHLFKVLGHETPNPFWGKPSLVLAPGEIKSDIRIALARALAIEGHVLNEYGEPMADVYVTAVGDPLGGTQGVTDDRGRFRLFGLAPARYTVCANPHGGSRMGRTASEGDGLAARYDRTCAPNQIVTKAGGTPTVQIQMQRVGAFTLSGTVVSATGADVSEARISINRIRPDGIGGDNIVAEVSKGQFVARGLVPGEYSVHAWFGEQGSWPDFRESAVVPVQIEATDVTGVTVTTVPAATLNGRVERDPRTTAPLPSGVTLRMVSPHERLRYAMFQPSPVKTGPDGTFTIKGVFGPSVISINSLPTGWFVASVRHGDEDITDQPREFRAGDERSVVIVLSNRSATLRARPVGEDGQPKTDALVLLFPADPRRWTVLPIGTMSGPDKDGFYQLDARAPGDYLVTAVPAQDLTGPLRSGTTLESIARLGRRITLIEGETLALDVRVHSSGERR